jgi:hypothetical protein
VQAKGGRKTERGEKERNGERGENYKRLRAYSAIISKQSKEINKT